MAIHKVKIFTESGAVQNSAYLSLRNRLNFTKSDLRAYRHMAEDVGILAAAGFLSRTGWVGIFLSFPLLATFMFRSFSMMHEAVHGTAHSNRRTNEALGHFYGACCFLPYSQWKQIHLQHHMWTGNLDMDPTMKIIKMFKDNPVKPSRFQELTWRWWLPYLAYRQQIVFWKKSCENLLTPKWRAAAAVPFELLLSLIFLGASVFALGPAASGLAVLAYLVLIELINFPHHTGLSQDAVGVKLAPKDQYKMARSVVYWRWFNRGVLLNFNYHVEHHLFPTLPWYRLEEAHAHVRETLNEEFNLSYGNEWLIASRKISFFEILRRSTEAAQRSEKTKLVS